MSKRALITGISGQIGTYLAKHLVETDCDVVGIARDESDLSTLRRFVDGRVIVHFADLSTRESVQMLAQTLAEERPDEIYHLAAHLPAPDLAPDRVVEATGVSTVRLLEAAKAYSAKARVFVALSAEMFDTFDPAPKNERSPLLPRSAYAASKALSYYVAQQYRGTGLRVACGILFNCDSEIRNPKFFSRKVTSAVARICAGSGERLCLGNLASKRDRGHAEDYAKACRTILLHDQPDDFVIATGLLRTSEDFVRAAFSRAGLDWRDHVDIDPSLSAASDPPSLVGDASKARRVLGWRPETDFDTLVARMVDHDLLLAKALS